MKVGIVRYPGSNCDLDTKRYFSESVYIWHNDSNVSIVDSIDMLVIPGGFAFGDRVYKKATDTYTVSPGTQALNSPVSKIILTAAQRKIPILGICNGFQILTGLGLLPGKLEVNKTNKFICKQVECVSAFSAESYKMYIANKFGNYVCNEEITIFLEYKQNLLEYETKIAGVCNKEETIFGMMPHPERNESQFRSFLYRLMFSKMPKTLSIQTQALFETKIRELMMSEHISYKTTRRYLKKLHTQEEWVVQGPGENAGIVDIGNGYCIALRIESHNHPTFINPYEGAATGVGGIIRDIFTMGAKPIAILDFLRFGIDNHSQTLLSSAIEGISYYGNCVGVPNIGGDLYVDPSYNKNPIVNVGCIGIVKKENIIYGNAESENDILIYIGSKTGKEGVGGAAMASKSFNSSTNIHELHDTIQKSDPFLEKLLIDACQEITELKLAVGMQDLGAGGLLCASMELISRAREKYNKDFGCEIYKQNIPTKCAMNYCDVLISESQERMLLVAKPSNYDAISNILKKWDLEYAFVGKVTLCGNYNVYHGHTLLYKEAFTVFKDIHDYTYNASSDYAPKNVVITQKIRNMDLWSVYDSTVGNRTLKGPDKPGHYAILDIYEINKQLFVTWGETFDICYSKMIQFEGVKPLAIVNCLNYGHPKDSLDSLVYTLKELNIKCKKFNIPVVGGNVSLYNSTNEISIRSTPIFLMIGIN